MNNEDRDSEHLRLLRIGHYVGAGLGAAGLAFLALHYLLMRTVLSAASEEAVSRGSDFPPDRIFGTMLPWLYGVFALLMLTSAVLNLISAACIARRRARTFSMVVAGLNCMHAPLGTALGVLTILVLARESVRQSYRS